MRAPPRSKRAAPLVCKAVGLIGVFVVNAQARAQQSWLEQLRNAWTGTEPTGEPQHRELPNISDAERSLRGEVARRNLPSAASPRTTTEESRLPQSETPISAGNRDPQDSAGFRPDRTTSLHETVRYHEVFEPAIAPWKRLIALERVTLDTDGTPILLPYTGDRHVVSIVRAPDFAVETFVGRVVLDFGSTEQNRQNTRTILRFPSVAPTMQLSYLQVEPETRLSIERDDGGNFFALLRNPPLAGVPPLRVVFGAFAESAYFGGDLPNVRADVLAMHNQPMPEMVARDARMFASELGLSNRSTLSDVITRLTEHFRAFVESDEPPADTGNIYLDLVRGGRGICRHRAFGFVITAQALGVHARFVHNEAHAWVEVELPGSMWRRIDLGGATGEAQVTGLQQNFTPHQPEADQLPRPPNYAESRNAMLPQQGTGNSAPSGTSANGTSANGTNPATPNPNVTANMSPSASVVTTEIAPANNVPPRVSAQIEALPGQAQRGLMLEVRGTVANPGTCLVWVYAQPTRGSADPLRLGQATSVQGTFTFRAALPRTMSVGEHHITPVVIHCDS